MRRRLPACSRSTSQSQFTAYLWPVAALVADVEGHAGQFARQRWSQGHLQGLVFLRHLHQRWIHHCARGTDGV